MKLYNDQAHTQLEAALQKALACVRRRRGFCAGDYSVAKAALLNDYMRQHGLSACVVGVSGGIDSAVVLALVVQAAKQEDSPIKTILPLLLPLQTAGATNQDIAVSRGREVIQKLGLAPMMADLTSSLHALKTEIDKATHIKGEAWAEGQLVSYIRTPALYYATSILNQQGMPAIVIGTTNRDEGAYLGFFGKASDGMVDVQLIADLHKSEVNAVARALEVPESICMATPTGDMYDGRIDEEVFGTSYDFVELYLALREMDAAERTAIMQQWNNAELGQYTLLSGRLEKLHRYNAHKYTVGSPAFHLDIMPSAIPGGWQHGTGVPAWNDKPDTASFVAPFTLSSHCLEAFDRDHPHAIIHTQTLQGQTLQRIGNFLAPTEAARLVEEVQLQKWLRVSMNGMRKNYREGIDQTGSFRASTYHLELASLLWHRLSGHVPMILHTPKGSSQDAQGAMVWRAIGINPLFRFIRYEAGCALIPHYDAPYDYGDGRRTLKSLLIYLTTSGPNEKGATRFIHDPQLLVPVSQRNYADWDRFAEPNEVECAIQPEAGHALLFDHRMLHDCEMLEKGPRLVMRTDIVYQKVMYP